MLCMPRGRRTAVRLCPPATASFGHILAPIATHYDVLGVAPDAPPDQIRSAYRRAARQLHPDHAHSSSDAMATVNEAYRVLADPRRRLLYDRSLRGKQTGSTVAGREARFGTDVEADGDRPPTIVADRPTFLSPAGPARVPWKLMAVLATIGTGAVLISATRDSSSGDEPPDGIIRPGSCVEIETNGDAREVACDAASSASLVVEVLVPLDATCPSGTVGHRDRLGLGIACIAA
jgi:hypothetical protein